MFFGGDGMMGKMIKGLSASSLRQRVIAHNLANFNTPGFKRSTVSFEDQLSLAGKRQGSNVRCTHPDHLGGTRQAANPKIIIEHSTTRRLDGNNVDLEIEMLNMVTNQLRYNAYVQQINSRFNQWRYVINEGRR